MEKPSESVLKRIKKLLALANDAGATEGERDNAMRMAHATLAKYNLEMSDLPGDQEARRSVRQMFYGRPWARRVANAVAELMFCRYVYIPNADAKYVGHIFIGKESNGRSAGLLAEFLVQAIYKEGKAATRRVGAGNSYFRSFGHGAADKIVDRVSEIITAAIRPAEKAPGTALVLASLYQTERNANELIVAEMKLGKGADGKPANDWGARLEGREYASKLSLNQQVGQEKNDHKQLENS